MRDLQKIDFSGVLDTDSSPELVKPIDYTDAKNIQPLTNNTESSKSHIPVKGNTLAFSLGSVTAQNKKWRIYTSWDNASTKHGTVYFFDQNAQLMYDPTTYATPIYFLLNVDNVTQATHLSTGGGGGLVAFFGGGNYTCTGVNVTNLGTSGTGYIEIELLTISNYDWDIISTTSTTFIPLITDSEFEIEVVQEAIDVTLTGENNDIASYDLLGDLFLLSTPQRNLPTVVVDNVPSLPIAMLITVTINVAPTPDVYRVTCSNPHNLSSGMKVQISDVDILTPGIVSPNGLWIINVINATTFDLLEYYNVTTGMTATASTGKITLYTEGIGEIGVAQKDVNTAVWTYTKLLRTKQWNFRTKKQTDFRVGERTSVKDSLYWTNDYEIPRCFYYNRPQDGIFENYAYGSNGLLPLTGDLNGAISIINPNGHYSYRTINEETKLLLSPTGAKLAFTTQSQGGGQVPSGNWRYAFRFLSDSLSATEWSELSNPINVYTAGTSSPQDIHGDAAGVVTGKINNFHITGIIPALFKYVELAGINYVGNAIEGWIIKRVLLDGVSSTIDISHTGTETAMQNLDVPTVNTKYEPIETVKNMNVIDKRMILSNVTIAGQRDLTTWAQTFKHTLLKKSITSVGTAVAGTLQFGEYQDPQNVNKYMGYMDNDTYRVGVKAKYKSNGFWSDVFWIDDICFTTFATNLNPAGNPASTRTGATDGRVAGLPDFNLTNAGAASTYTSYVNINNIDTNYLIDGIRIRDLFDEIEIVRSECIPEILACGIGILGLDATTANIQAADYGATNIYTLEPQPASSAATDIMECGYPVVASYNQPLYAAFYSPDILFDFSSITYQAADKIINHGVPQIISTQLNDNTGGNPLIGNSFNSQWSGYTQATSNVATFTVQINTLAANGAITVGEGSSHTFGGDTFWKRVADVRAGANSGTFYQNNVKGLVFKGGANFIKLAGVAGDYGYYYMQYYRALTNKYGDPLTSKYVTCGATLKIDNSPPAIANIDVFGGDTFTQLSYFRSRLASIDTTLPLGLGHGFSFYSQNRVNAQMKFPSSAAAPSEYPNISSSFWLERVGNDNDQYQSGYTIRNQVTSGIAFDPNIDQVTDLPATIFYTGVKVLDSPQDGYRVVLPLDRHDLDISDGEIVQHEDFNGELFTEQPLKIQRQFFNSRGELQTSVTAIVVGDGTVMSRDGQTITSYGNSHKWSHIKGKSIGGNDTVYWIDITAKRAFRLASDGTISISDIRGMKSFFANNLQWVIGKDTPADGNGICGIWHDRFNQAVWTVMGHRYTPYNWKTGITYSSVGMLVAYQPSTFSTYEKTGELFLLKSAASSITPVAVYPLPNVITTLTGTTTLTITTTTNHLLVSGDQVKLRGVSGLSADINETFYTITYVGVNSFTITVSALTNAYVGSSGSIVEVNPKYWTFIPHTDNNYYNEYTIVYSEYKKGFTCFLTPKPRIYNQWQTGYLNPSPISPLSDIFEANTGTELTFFPSGSHPSQTEDGFIEAVINKGSEQAKTFISVDVDSDVTPDKMDFTTTTQKTFLTSSEFEQNEGSFYSDVKEDSTVTATNPTGLNSLDTGLMSGKYMKAKFYFAVATYNRLVNFIINFVFHFPQKGH